MHRPEPHQGHRRRQPTQCKKTPWLDRITHLSSVFAITVILAGCVSLNSHLPSIPLLSNYLTSAKTTDHASDSEDLNGQRQRPGQRRSSSNSGSEYKSEPSTDAGNNSKNIINGIVVPPDPGKNQNLTVAGVDTDHNGIRDEVDRWLATNYGKHPKLMASLQKKLRSSQKLLVSKPANSDEAMAIIYENFDVGFCTNKKMILEKVPSGPFFTGENLILLNTEARFQANRNIFLKAGGILRLRGNKDLTCA